VSRIPSRIPLLGTIAGTPRPVSRESLFVGALEDHGWHRGSLPPVVRPERILEIRIGQQVLLRERRRHKPEHGQHSRDMQSHPYFSR
jgi:hypothetical protein